MWLTIRKAVLTSTYAYSCNHGTQGHWDVKDESASQAAIAQSRVDSHHAPSDTQVHKLQAVVEVARGTADLVKGKQEQTRPVVSGVEHRQQRQSQKRTPHKVRQEALSTAARFVVVVDQQHTSGTTSGTGGTSGTKTYNTGEQQDTTYSGTTTCRSRQRLKPHWSRYAMQWSPHQKYGATTSS